MATIYNETINAAMQTNNLDRLSHQRLKLRAEVLTAIRSFFTKAGYLEVETPVRIPAPAPETHIEAVASEEWFLHTSPELCMKRLLAVGHERIFQICRCFRHSERGRYHLPEMTLLEWYTAHHDYSHMMDQCQMLIQSIVEQIQGEPKFAYQGRTIDVSGEWLRITVQELFDRAANVTVEQALAQDQFDEIMATQLEPYLATFDHPVIVHEYPAQCAALARLSPDNPTVAERFELYIAGIELCNAFGELVDAMEQRKRFVAENAERQRLGKPPYSLPEPFLQDLEKMPPATGNALGIDRLIMLLADADRIDDVVAFVPEAL